MRRFQTWKQMRPKLALLSGKRSFDSFFKEELQDSCSVIHDVINKRPVIDLSVSRSLVDSFFKHNGGKSGNTSA